VFGMALRRDVARCVKVVDILTVDRLCDMTCQHYDWMMTRVFSDKNRYDVDKMAQAIKIDVTQCLRKPSMPRQRDDGRCEANIYVSAAYVMTSC